MTRWPKWGVIAITPPPRVTTCLTMWATRRNAPRALLVGRRQDRDLLRANSLRDRHDVDCRAQEDVLVAADQQRLRTGLGQRFADLFLQPGELELPRSEI